MTNKNISLTIPNDDPIALHEFGAAMQRMASRHNATLKVVDMTLTDDQLDSLKIGATEPTHVIGESSKCVDADKAQLAALGNNFTISVGGTVLGDYHTTDEPVDVALKLDRTDAPDTTPSHLDSDGLPWDARIHASSKERNTDDTWRARRKPSDMDAGQWAEFQGQVRTELRALMELPVELEELRKQVEAIKESPTRDTVVVYYTNADDGIGYKHAVQGKSVEQAVVEVRELFNVAAIKDVYLNNELQSLVSPVVVEPVEPEPIVVTPPPVVAPPAPVAPPVPTGTGPTEFVPFLQWITSSGITPEQVNVALAQHGLTAVPQLQQRPDLIPQVHASIVAGV